MKTQSEKQIIDAIKLGEPFEALTEDGALEIKIQQYVPYICTAIHAGHRFRADLEAHCLLSETERYEEEDPHTDTFIHPFPILLIAKDSRYEYDLNRPPEECIYDMAWGKKVWKKDLPQKEKKISLNKHAQYYRILKALVDKLSELYKNCLILDLHSYNWQRPDKGEHTPVFNIGTSQLNVKKWHNILQIFEESLAKIALPNMTAIVERDTVFQGKGYQASFIKKQFPDTPLIPLELKKVFMNEKTGESFPIIIEAMKQGLSKAILDMVTEFNKHQKSFKKGRAALIPSIYDDLTVSIDKTLYKLVRNIDTLQYVNPTNTQIEKKRFFSRKKYNPDFHYKHLNVDPYTYRERLYALPVSKIQDPLLKKLYRAVIDNYATKLEMLAHVGRPDFLYNSLRYYGEPNPKDIKNAHFILHAPPLPDIKEETKNITPEMAVVRFDEEAKRYGIKCKTIISSRIMANAMVDNTKETIFINRNAILSETDLQALIHHELGIHMLTTMNAKTQPLRILQLSLPGNTYTQEGLAILSEYLSGNMPLKRLKKLALRVIAVDMLVQGANFEETYNVLREKYHETKESAFSITARVYRGGGFTKDFLYLRGFKDMVTMYHERSINSLFIGKTSHIFIDDFDELIERKVFKAPQHIPFCLSQNKIKEQSIFNYLIEAIK